MVTMASILIQVCSDCIPSGVSIFGSQTYNIKSVARKCAEAVAIIYNYSAFDKFLLFLKMESFGTDLFFSAVHIHFHSWHRAMNEHIQSATRRSHFLF